MADISEEELDWLADRFILYAREDPEFSIKEIVKCAGNSYSVIFLFRGTRYGSYFLYEQDKEQRTN